MAQKNLQGGKKSARKGHWRRNTRSYVAEFDGEPSTLKDAKPYMFFRKAGWGFLHATEALRVVKDDIKRLLWAVGEEVGLLERHALVARLASSQLHNLHWKGYVRR